MPGTAILADRPHVVIIGGGAIGSSIAWHLATEPRFKGTVTVIERDPTYARASSALSASSIRQQFSTALNIALSQAGFRFLCEAAERLAVNGDRPALGLRTPGYLFLAAAEGAGVLRENHAVQLAAGANVALLDADALAARFPWLSVAGVAAGALGLAGEGWFDGPALLAAFRRAARRRGVIYLAQEAVGFERAGARVNAVRLAGGGTVGCDVAVNAAGPWSGQVAAWLGLALPVRPRRRSVFVFACRQRLPGCPLVIDTSGTWFRPEGAGFICGRSPGEGEPDPDEPPLVVDEAEFTERMWPALATRVPAFEAVKLTASWAGYYELNTFDGNAVVGPLPGAANAFVAAGFSGHGLQHAPGVGRAMAELITTGSYRTLDLGPLAFARIPAGRPLLERNIV